MKDYEKFIADDRFSTPEYLDRLRNMTPEEFEQHIKKLKEEYYEEQNNEHA